MKIQIRSRDVAVPAVLRAHVERRLAFALGRFGERIGCVTVRLSDAGGQPSGAAQCCRIEVGLGPRSERAEDTDADRFAAVDHAIDRVSRSVARALELGRERDGGLVAPRTSRTAKT